MAKLRRTQISSDTSLGGVVRAQDATKHLGALRPATRNLRDVLAERGPLTGPITDVGTQALLSVRGERPDGGHGSR
jgi:hypothetical protein